MLYPTIAGGISNSCLVWAVKHAKMQAVIGRRAMTKINKQASKNCVTEKWQFWREARWAQRARNLRWHAEISDHAVSVLACSLCVCVWAVLARKVLILVKLKPLNHQCRPTRQHEHTRTHTGWQNRGIPVLICAPSMQVHPWFPSDPKLPACLPPSRGPSPSERA